MTFSTTKTFPEAVAKDKQFKEVFLNVGAKIRDIEIKSTRQNWNDKDHELSESLLKSKMAVRIALCDSFDTKEAVNELAKLVTATNTYIKQPDKNIKVPLLRQISRYIFQMLKTFGVYEDSDLPSLSSGKSPEEVIKPMMDALAEFRDSVRELADKGKKPLLDLSDQLRDDKLPKLGIQLKDGDIGEKATWNFKDPEQI